MAMWMVRAGQGGYLAERFLEEGIVGLGWAAIGDPNSYSSKSDMLAAAEAAYTDKSASEAAAGAHQLWRFRSEVKEGDELITYDPAARLYYAGMISGPAVFVDDVIEEKKYRRAVAWRKRAVARDDLSGDARNRLGSSLTLFAVPASVAAELRALLDDEPVALAKASIDDEAAPDPFVRVFEEAGQRIGDAIARLDWRDMQALVAALLRARGYKTEISPDGPDRGRDIVASPDGFGFEQPRIVVEVKHRQGEKIDAAALRSFLGGRHKDDRGLYVSTGGFTRDAQYQADRSTIPVKLMAADDLARAIAENYERFDPEGRALLPLRRLYWPA